MRANLHQASTPFRLGVDLDGVLYPFGEVFARNVEREYGLDPFSLLPPSSWDFFENEWGFPKAEFHVMYGAGVVSGDLFSAGLADTEVLAALSRLASLGVELHVLTSRALSEPVRGTSAATLNEMITSHTHTWLTMTGLPLHSVNVVHGSKLGPARSLGLDALLDDSPHHLAEVASACTTVAWDQPWNRAAPSVHRVSTADELVNTVQQLRGLVDVCG
jgi:hypothetical protein